MRRARIDLDQVADLGNLARATWLAARGKRARPEVACFLADLEHNLERLAAGILDGTRPLGIYRRHLVYDPKPRVIHAPCFEDRILHHALFAHTEERLFARPRAPRLGKNSGERRSA